MKTPITYYGGKQRLLKELLPLIPIHKVYIEAFTGGGALFFAKPPSEAEIINDLNGNVTNFYSVLQTDFEELKKLIDGTLHSRATYKEALRVYHNSEHALRVYNNKDNSENNKETSARQRAWAFWVLTNQGFSGKIGSWALSKQDNKVGKTLANKREGFTKEYAERLKYVQIESEDAIRVIKHYDTTEAFIYVDPPYFNSDCGHYKGYTETDYRKLLDTLVEVKGKFLLSSYPSELLKEYVKKYGWRYREIKQKVRVSHLCKKEKIEVLVWNYEISPAESLSELIPDIKPKQQKKLIITKPIAEPVIPCVQKFSDKSKEKRAKNLPEKINKKAEYLHLPKACSNFDLGLNKDFLKSLNPERKPLTVETLKTFEGFEKTGDKEAEDIVYAIHSLCRIVYEYMMEQNNAEDNKNLTIAA